MKTMLSEIIHCMSPLLVVSDLGRSLKFYTKQLGFEINFRHEGFYAGIGLGHHSIHLKLGDPSSSERQRRRRNEDVDLIFGVKDLDGMYEHVCSQAMEIVQPLRVMPYGREFYIGDPDGYVLAFFDVTS
ncbi:MAG: VOC family protein [Prosthecobacter sp.]|nr:VOC family protein [Prosthecobacter sp.]